MIVERGKLPKRVDLIGRMALCVKSYMPKMYVEGEIVEIVPCPNYIDGIKLKRSDGRIAYNGHDAEWKILEETPDSMEDLI
jgi:hypothetical protein